MKKLKNVLIFGSLFLIADQMLKIILSDRLAFNQSYLLIKNLLYINLVHNTGAAFGIFEGSRLLLIFVAIFALIAICIFVIGNDNLRDKDILIYSLLVGGILGNLVDRIIHGYVIDYISLTFGKFNFPVFNFADICITLSIIILLLDTILGSTIDN